MKETWRPIKGLEGEYEASNFGRVRSIDRFITNPGNPNGGYRQYGKLLIACAAKNGYNVVNIGKRRGTKYVHRLVATAFLGEIPQGMTINHKDGDKSNNRIENLEIVTYRENHLHAFRVLHRTPSCLGRTNTNVSKPVVQQKDGVPIAEYLSARDAERKTGVGFKGISACCHGKAKTAGGYEWMFKSSAEPQEASNCAQK